MASKQSQLAGQAWPQRASLYPCQPRAWVLQSCCGAREWGRSRGLAIIATLWKPSVAEGGALAAKQAGESQGTNFRWLKWDVFIEQPECFHLSLFFHQKQNRALYQIFALQSYFLAAPGECRGSRVWSSSTSAFPHLAELWPVGALAALLRTTFTLILHVQPAYHNF